MRRRRLALPGTATTSAAGLALLASLGAAGPLDAADLDGRGPEIELRADIAGATARANERALGIGIGAGVRLAWPVSRYVSLYADYGRRELADDDESAPTLEHEGYALGLELRWSEPHARLALRLAGGITHDSITVTNGPAAEETRRGNGWEVGVATLVPLTGGWTLVPGLRYRRLSDVSSPADGTFDDTLALVLVEIGALWTF